MHKLSLILLLFLLIPALYCHAQVRDSVTLITPTGTIYGTLTYPKSMVKVKVPLVIIIPGSGPTDRNGNNGQMSSNTLRILSDSLAKYGIASLRYDKRGIAMSRGAAPNEANLRFMTYVDDVKDWVSKYKKDKRFESIFILGHSEGSLIGMIAASSAPVAGYISVAGAGKPADQLMLDQLEKQATPTFLDSCKYLFGEIRKNGSVSPVPNGLYQMYFRKSVQPYIASWIKYDPAVEIAKVKVPVLILQGTRDLQVDTIQARMLANAKPDAQFKIIPDMNHIFRDVKTDDPGDNIGSYYDGKMPINSDFVRAVMAFIRSNLK